MSKNSVSKSPERHTFQAESYIKRCEEEGKEPREAYLDMYKTWREHADANANDPEWQEYNMEYDLRTNDHMLKRVRESDAYAQNLYAAICNNDFIKIKTQTPAETMETLAERYWSASWRSSGGIIADMRQQGDYIDWYCSGIGNSNDGYGLTHQRGNGFVPEGRITEEISADLKTLGWVVAPGGDWENFE